MNTRAKNKFLSNTDIEKCMILTQAVLYGGNIKESFVETRIDIYSNQKIKGPTALPLDSDCATQVIFRTHYQCYCLVYCFQEIISPIPYQDYEWFFYCESYFIRPVWFKGDQFSSLLATKFGS